MSQSAKPRLLTPDEAHRLGDKYWLVEEGIWSVTTARQWLTRQSCLQHIEKLGHQANQSHRMAGIRNCKPALHAANRTMWASSSLAISLLRLVREASVDLLDRGQSD